MNFAPQLGVTPPGDRFGPQSVILWNESPLSITAVCPSFHTTIAPGQWQVFHKTTENMYAPPVEVVVFPRHCPSNCIKFQPRNARGIVRVFVDNQIWLKGAVFVPARPIEQ